MNEPTLKPTKRKVLIWNKMLRLSIYFTIFGVGLSYIYSRLIRTRLEQFEKVTEQAEGVAPPQASLDPMLIPCLIMVVGILSIVVCLLMRSREKKALCDQE